LRGQYRIDPALQHVHEPEPDRHGDLLQGLPAGGLVGDQAKIEPLWLRAGNYGQGGREEEPGLARIRGADQLFWPNLRRRKKDRPQGCLHRALLHRPLSAVRLSRRAARTKTIQGTWKGLPMRWLSLAPIATWLAVLLIACVGGPLRAA